MNVSLFSAFLKSSDLHEPGARIKKNSTTENVFSLKVQDFGGFGGHIPDMSNVLSCVLKIHRTGHRTVPTKVIFLKVETISKTSVQ